MIQKIKDALIHLQTYSNSLGYENKIDSMGYADVPPGKGPKIHEPGYWHQKNWNETQINKVDWAEKIRFCIKEKS